MEQSNPNCFSEKHLNKKLAVFELKKDSKTMVAQNDTLGDENKKKNLAPKHPYLIVKSKGPAPY